MIHCRNKKNDTLSIKHFTDSNELPESWNDFVPDGHFLRTERLKVTEQSNLPNLSFCYVQVFDADKLVLVAGFQLLRLKKKHINRQMVKPWQHLIWQTFTNTVRPKLLIGGHLFRHDVSSVFYNNESSDYDAYTYYEEAVNAAMQVTCASAVLIKDMPDKFSKYFRNYQPNFIALRNDISMEMDIPADWGDITDYEKAIKHKYAQRFRKIRQPLDSLAIKPLSRDYVAANKNRLFDLYQNVAQHQQVRIGFLSPDFLVALQKSDDRLKVWGIYEDDKLIAFFSAWVYEHAFDMFYIGFDYNKNREYNLYFNMLYFAVEQAIAHKRPKLILGRTALDAKARLGCKPKYLSTFLYIKNSMVNRRIMQIQKNTTDKEGAWESRHPFKKVTTTT